jgi:hypothetical protein
MKYVRVSIEIEAKTEEEAYEILKDHMEGQTVICDVSMHCTDHDPELPTMWITVHNEDDPNMRDSCDGGGDSK